MANDTDSFLEARNRTRCDSFDAGPPAGGFHELASIAEQYRGAFLCDGVGLGKTFIGLMLIESLIKRHRKRVALFVPKAARKPVWEDKLRRYLPELFGEYSNLVI